MRTFKLTLSLDMKAVVPEQFTQSLREQAVAEDATDFLANAQKLFPDDDEGFTLHILKHGLRNNVRSEIAKLFERSGLGCTLSPVTAQVHDRTPPSVPAVLATEIDSALQGTASEK